MPDDGKWGKRQMAEIVEDDKALQTEGVLPALLMLMIRLCKCQNFWSFFNICLYSNSLISIKAGKKIVICVFQWDSLRKLILDSSHMLNLTILRAKVIPNSLAFETSILPKPTRLLSSKAKELTAVDILMFQCMLGTCCCHCPLVAFADGVLSYKML